MLKKRD